MMSTHEHIYPDLVVHDHEHLYFMKHETNVTCLISLINIYLNDLPVLAPLLFHALSAFGCPFNETTPLDASRKCGHLPDRLHPPTWQHDESNLGIFKLIANNEHRPTVRAMHPCKNSMCFALEKKSMSSDDIGGIQVHFFKNESKRCILPEFCAKGLGVW